MMHTSLDLTALQLAPVSEHRAGPQQQQQQALRLQQQQNGENEEWTTASGQDDNFKARCASA
jgi:hypothetical protein